MSQTPSIPGPETPPEKEGPLYLRGIFASCANVGPPSAHIEALRPTQMTVGFHEVAEKRKRWRAAKTAVQASALPSRTVPVVIGPSAKLYAVDRHHWLCAFAAEGVREVSVLAVEDLAHLEEVNFWTLLEDRDWCHPYDALGRRRAWAEMPTSIAQLMDDPFRSLASALRRAGGFAKHPAPFSEFAWATHLRCHIPLRLLEHDFDAALRESLRLSRDHSAAAARPIQAASCMERAMSSEMKI